MNLNYRILSLLGACLLFSFSFSSVSHAQNSPLLNATDGATGNQLAGATDDFLAGAIQHHQAGKNKGGGLILDGYAMGRLRSTNHDGYKGRVPAEDSVDFSATEWSVFGAASFSFQGPIAGSRMSVTPFVGYTKLDIDLGTAPQAGVNIDAGSATNKAFLYGFSTVYSKGDGYAAFSVTGATGKTDITDRFTAAPNTFPINYDTQGIILSGLVGKTVPVVATDNVFASFSGGLRYIDFGGDKFVNTGGTAFLNTRLTSTTALLSGEIFSVIKGNGITYRPYLKNILQLDIDYSLKETIDPFVGASFSEDHTRDALSNKTEIGLNVAGDGVNFSAAAFGEFANDRTTFGGRLGATFKLN